MGHQAPAWEGPLTPQRALAITIPLSGAGGLATRWGHAFAALADALALRGGAATARVLSGANMAARMNTIESDYAAGTPLNQVADGIYGDLTALQGGMGSIFSALSTRAQNTLKAMWSVDQGFSANAPLSVLTAVDTTTALKTLFQQMTAAGASFQQSTPVTSTPQTALGIPNGNPVIVGSLRDARGLVLNLIFPETLTFTCTSDSQGGATLGNEPVAIRGAPAVSDVWSQLWPGGSGASSTVNAVDGTKSNAAGNKLVNSDFVTFTTANLPDNWSALVGVAGTDIFNGGTGNAYTSGGGSLQFTGTASALLVAVAQPFNTPSSTAPGAGGTPSTLSPDTQYAFNCWVKCSATPTAGVLEISLVDGTNTTINDDQGVAQLLTQSLTAVSTTFVNFKGAIRTPAVLPSTVKLRVRLSTAIDSGKSVFVSRLGFTPMAQIYAGGPFFSIFSGSNKMIAGATPDTWTFGLGNTYGQMIMFLHRIFNLPSLNLTPPAAASPTLSDATLIV